MKYKKFILPSIMLLVLLFSITAISAADLNNTDNAEGDVLKDDEVGDWPLASLYLDVKDAGSTLELVDDYKYDKKSDYGFESGINITKTDFIINGNNHVIDCGNHAKVFNITGKNVTINNLIIKNAHYASGSAISTASDVTLNNVTFINCSGDDRPNKDNSGAIQATGGYLKINDCNFIDNSGGEGASISAYSSKVDIFNSTFISSSDKIIKGQICLDKSELTVYGSNFLNTTSKYATAILAEDNCKIKISNSKFRNLFANQTAGAISIKSTLSLTIYDCEFYNVSSANNGGAIFVDTSAQDESNNNGIVIINNTEFNECHSGFGGAILQLAGKMIITNSRFYSNDAFYGGGAIYTSYVAADIFDSIFRNNSASYNISYGGACYFDMGNVTLMNNIFENNTGSLVSTIYAYDTNLSLQKNFFDNPSNATSIYTVYGKVFDYENIINGDENSTDNTNYFYNFENTANPFIILDNTIDLDDIPEKFDLREYGWVTPVKDQGFMGACWAFGNMAALESSLLRYTNVSYSLSVNNMQNSMIRYSKYGSTAASEGSFSHGSYFYLIDWLGVYPDVYDGYDELGKISPLYSTPEDIHIQNVVVIPPIKNALGIDTIKTALMKYGGVAVTHYADFDEDKYYNPVYSAQYYNDKNGSPDHVVCIVGWDDNFSKNYFVAHPPGDGAWIVKNSWGENWGENGYFYVSYYDTSIAALSDSVAYIITNDSYNRIYQYDIGGSPEWSSNAAYYANRFVADENELIAAVGTFFKSAGDEYQIFIAVNDVDVYVQNGVSKISGYETINLDKLVQIKKGDSFIVGFKNKMFYVDSLRIHTQKNQSFASTDGKNWEDLKEKDVVAIVKAYTVSDINITKNLVKYYGNDTPFVANVGANETVIFEYEGEFTNISSDDGLAKLPIESDVGEYSITTTYNNISIVNYVVIKSTIVSSDVTRGYNSNYNYKVQVLTSAGIPLNNTQIPISVNGKFKNYTSDESGYVTVPFTKLTQQQTIIVTNPSNADNKKTKIEVKSRFAGASNVAMYYYDGSKFKAYAVGDDGKVVGKNQVVTIKLNKKTYKIKTDAKGLITFKIPNTVKPGTYKLKATYKGQTITKTVKVKQNLKTKKYTVKKSAKKLVVKATLKNGKTALKNKKITLKVNGKKITAKTNKKGIAKLTIKKNVIKKLKAGKKYTMKLTYLKNTIKTTLKVKR